MENRVYLAAPYSLKPLMEQYARELKEDDINVVSSWLEEPHPPDIQLWEVPAETHRQYAVRDIEDIHNSDAMVFFVDQTRSLVRGGRHVEFGIALESNIPIFVVGDFENMFHYLPQIEHFSNWELAKNALTSYLSLKEKECLF